MSKLVIFGHWHPEPGIAPSKDHQVAFQHIGHVDPSNGVIRVTDIQGRVFVADPKEAANGTGFGVTNLERVSEWIRQ